MAQPDSLPLKFQGVFYIRGMLHDRPGGASSNRRKFLSDVIVSTDAIYVAPITLAEPYGQSNLVTHETFSLRGRVVIGERGESVMYSDPNDMMRFEPGARPYGLANTTTVTGRAQLHSLLHSVPEAKWILEMTHRDYDEALRSHVTFRCTYVVTPDAMERIGESTLVIGTTFDLFGHVVNHSTTGTPWIVNLLAATPLAPE